MSEWNNAVDSQAAYNAMPNQGLPVNTASPAASGSSMTPQQRQQLAQIAAQLLQSSAKPLGQMTGMQAPQQQAVPIQTLSAGQMVGGRQ